MSCYTTVECSHYWNLLHKDKDYEQQEDEDQKFNTPMLWIGLYIAAASLLCSLQTAADVIRGFVEKKFWFPCKYFTLNAFSLTLLAVAVKFPLDINTSMPGEPDQLVKLSSSAFLCIVMGNFMPSLGAIHDKGILSNVTALGILVITLVVNICIELDTGVIYSSLQIEYILVSLFMIVLLVILFFSALAVPSTKKYIEWKYGEMHKIALSDQEVPEEAEGRTRIVEKLFGDVRKYWMMAETGNPQFVLARSVTCAAAGVICLFTTFILAEAEIRLFFRAKKFWYSSDSDYKSSTLLTLIVQSVGVVVGTIAPAFRWFIGTDYRCSNKDNIHSFKKEFKIESYWMQGLKEWKEKPIALRIHSRKCRKLVQGTKNLTVSICMGVQIGILLASKTVRVMSIISLSPVLSICCYCNTWNRKLIAVCTAPKNKSVSEKRPDVELDLSRYVLLLEGEEELPTRLLTRISDAMNRLIHIARKNQPKRLMELLDKSTSFKGVGAFDNDKVECLHSDEPPNCWSLPVVTLTSIAVALPNIRRGITDQLVRSVSEGLFYITLTEKSFDVQKDLRNIRTAADFLWLGVELYRIWLKTDLEKMALEGKTSMENLYSLNDIAKRTVLRFKKKMSGGPKENPLNWPVKVIAANSMYRISQTILLDNQRSRKNKTDEGMFEELCVMIADIVGACLTNLPRVIKMKCYCSAIESREESVLLAARLLGETEDILKSVQKHETPDLDLDKVAYIDEWRSIIKQNYSERCIHKCNDETSSYASPELHIDIE